MFMAPMLTLPAARFLVERRRAGGGEAAFHWTAALMALQLVLAETYSDTLW
jgi:hypothetical protein